MLFRGRQIKLSVRKQWGERDSAFASIFVSPSIGKHSNKLLDARCGTLLRASLQGGLAGRERNFWGAFFSFEADRLFSDCLAPKSVGLVYAVRSAVVQFWGMFMAASAVLCYPDRGAGLKSNHDRL